MTAANLPVGERRRGCVPRPTWQHEVRRRVGPAELGHAIIPFGEPPDALGVRAHRPLERRQPQERLLEPVGVGEVEQRAVKADEERDLCDCRQAAGERVDLVFGVELLNLRVQLRRVLVLVLVLQRLGRRLDRLHLGRRLNLNLGERERQRLDTNRERDDGGAVGLLDTHALQPIVQRHDRILKREDYHVVKPAGLGTGRRTRNVWLGIGKQNRVSEQLAHVMRGHAGVQHGRVGRATRGQRRERSKRRGEEAQRASRARSEHGVLRRGGHAMRRGARREGGRVAR